MTGAVTREIHAPSARAETLAVARALFHIVFWSALFVSAQTHAIALSGPAPAPSSPFERRFQDLPFDDQRVYRALSEGVVEAERIRSSTGRWPSADALAASGVPPFAPDPLDRAGYAWRSVQTGTKTDYIGTPSAASGRETFFALVVEPDPGTPDDPSQPADEVHHRLGDGTMIHVTIWTGPPLADTREAVGVLPPDKGYRQVLAATPPK